MAKRCKFLSIVHGLLKSDEVTTKRGLYYLDPGVFASQAQTDTFLDRISAQYKIPRDHFNVVASGKGLVAGDLVLELAEGGLLDCRDPFVSNTAFPIYLISNICSLPKPDPPPPYDGLYSHREE